MRFCEPRTVWPGVCRRAPLFRLSPVFNLMDPFPMVHAWWEGQRYGARQQHPAANRPAASSSSSNGGGFLPAYCTRPWRSAGGSQVFSGRDASQMRCGGDLRLLMRIRIWQQCSRPLALPTSSPPPLLPTAGLQNELPVPNSLMSQTQRMWELGAWTNRWPTTKAQPQRCEALFSPTYDNDLASRRRATNHQPQSAQALNAAEGEMTGPRGTIT